MGIFYAYKTVRPTAPEMSCFIVLNKRVSYPLIHLGSPPNSASVLISTFFLSFENLKITRVLYFLV